MDRLTAQQLARVLAVTSHDVNPVSGEMLLTWNPTGEPSLYLLPADGGEPTPLIEGRGDHGSWAANGLHLVFQRDEGGAETPDIILLDRASGAERNLTRDSFLYTWPRFAPDGRLAVISNRGGNFDPYLFDLESGTFRLLSTSDRAASSLVWSPDGRYLGFLRMADADCEGNARCTLHLYDSQRDEVVALGTLGGDLFHAPWSWLNDGAQQQLCLPADHDEYQELLLVSPDGEREWLMLEPGNKMDPVWSPDGSRLAYIRAVGGSWRLQVWDRATASGRDLSIGDGVHREPRWSPNGSWLSVLYQSAVNPPDLWQVPLDGPATPLTSSLPAEFPTDLLTPGQDIIYRTFDGREIESLLFTPRKANGTAIVLVHGGPASSHVNSWAPDVQLLANLGYTILAPNVRGSTNLGKHFRDLNRLDWGGGDLRDLQEANRYLRELGFHRIGIMGGSYGGYLTLMALVKQPTLWAAGAALYPIANLNTLYESSRGDLLPYLVDQIGKPDERAEFYHDRSPSNFVEMIRAPLLLLQGANDPRTPLSEARGMAERMALAGKIYSLVVYPDEGHGFQLRENREDSLIRVLAFFGEHLDP